MIYSDAQYETDAVLDHYFYHDNTAPFIALRLIQRLVSSNPTPRFIESVATAFRTGMYLSFGTGQYGDLASTVAAIFLDQEARNVLLDDDTSSGMLREPILKVTGLLRSMHFISNQRVPEIQDLEESIGQMAHTFDSVFSFFLPEFKPYGRVGEASLVSPEATLLDTPKVIGILNGVSSLVENGLSHCDGGFAPRDREGGSCKKDAYELSRGFLEFNRTTTPETQFSFETFEGPSLKGGFDNFWVSYRYTQRSGKAVPDPDPNSSGNHVLNFSQLSRTADMVSPPFTQNPNLGPYVAKFRYFSPSGIIGGGCIGYLHDKSSVWSFCDYRKSKTIPLLSSNGEWITCQFEIPTEINTFQLIMRDSTSSKADKISGDAYFDDIQVIPGSMTTCVGVHLQDVDPPGQVGYSDFVVNELATLLTAGRLDMTSRQIIRDAYDSSGSADEGLRAAQQLMLTTSEFHSTDTVRQTDSIREEYIFPEPTDKPYKAIIMVMFNGGCDSYNLLAPHTCTKGRDLYSQYIDLRETIALTRNQTNPIAASDQICETFGIHKGLPVLKDLYDDGDMLFLANTGVLSSPVTKKTYKAGTKVKLFSHNSMIEEAKRIDPLKRTRVTGVLGRMSDVLTGHGHNVNSFAIDGYSAALAGVPGVSSVPMFVVSSRGVKPFYVSEVIRKTISKLHNKTMTDSGFFGETWSSTLVNSLGVNDKLLNILPDSIETDFPDTKLGRKLEIVSKLISTRDKRGADRDTFYVEIGGFDTHDDVEERLNILFEEVNDAISALSDQLKVMKVWDNVTTIQLSDFARTLTPNGGNGKP